MPAMRILFPADYFAASKPDEAFADQAKAFAALGWSVSTVALEGGGQLRPQPQVGEVVLYRGWMLDAGEYADLAAKVSAQGAEMLSSLEHLSAHHIPHWYPLLVELTPETVVIDDLATAEATLQQLALSGWDRFFVKDYVKSLKTSIGSSIQRPEQITELMSEMEKFRGKIEGGLCIQRYEALKPETEQRYFVLNGQAFAADAGPIPEAVQACAKRISSPFFSVDLAVREDGEYRVVEIGDGQVSDLVGWNVQPFIEIWRSLSPSDIV